MLNRKDSKRLKLVQELNEQRGIFDTVYATGYKNAYVMANLSMRIVQLEKELEQYNN